MSSWTEQYSVPLSAWPQLVIGWIFAKFDPLWEASSQKEIYQDKFVFSLPIPSTTIIYSLN